MAIKKVYLDHGATTPVDSRVLKEMLPFFSEKFGNASSLHLFGFEAKDSLAESRKKAAKFLNASEKEIVFTSGGSESDNLALKGVAFANRNKGNHIITSKIEHPAVLASCDWLEKNGFNVTYLPVDKDGLIDLNDFSNAITGKTILASIMHVNNEIGTIEPIEEIGKICREKNVLFHVDAVQSTGKISIDLKKLNVDLLSVSAHKLYGPKGVGALYVRDGTVIDSWQHGGGHEFKKRAGTENVSGIVGFAKACEIASKEFDREKNVAKLRDKLVEKVLSEIPKAKLNGHPKNRLWGNANFSFDKIVGESLLIELSLNGVAASTGSACHSHEAKPSHVLIAIGLSYEQCLGSLRFTLGKENTASEINYAFDVLKEAVKKLRS